MSLTNTEFEAILLDGSKQITGDVIWSEDEDHSPAREFRCEVSSGSGWPIVLRGSYNELAGTLTYVLILSGVGRIYALDLGKDHKNPDRKLVGEKHKHRWSEEYKDKEAYVPNDITEPASRPVEVWEQFCKESNITHVGSMRHPEPIDEGEVF